MSKKKPKPMISTIEAAGLAGYTIQPVKLKYATSWWLFGPRPKDGRATNMGFFASEQKVIEFCESDHNRRMGKV